MTAAWSPRSQRTGDRNAEITTANAKPGDPRFVFFSRMLGRRVVAADGTRLGKLKDLVVATRRALPAGREPGRQGPVREPPVPVERRGAARRRRPGAAGGRRGRAAPHPPGLRPHPLAEEILDKQIVDVHDAKLVRVNDLHFLELKGQLRVAHVDVGFRGLIRRMGWEPLVDGTIGLLRPAAAYLKADQLVSWKLVQPLDQCGRQGPAGGGAATAGQLHPADLAEIVEELDRDPHRAAGAAERGDGRRRARGGRRRR